VLMHKNECFKTSSTVNVMTRALPNSEVRIQGVQHRPLDLQGVLASAGEVLLLFPETSAIPLSVEEAPKIRRPVTLIVPDGTWTQAKKIAARVSAFPGVRRVRVPTEVPSRYRLRSSDRGSRLCTLEAVARALGALESVEIQRSLESLLDHLVKRVLITRSGPQARL